MPITARRTFLSLWLVVATIFTVLPALPARAVAPDIVIRMGQTIIYTVPEGIDRVVVGDGTIVDVKPLEGQNRDLLITAKNPGVTNFLVWPSPVRGPDGRMNAGPVRPYNIEVLQYRRPEMVAVRVKIFEVARSENSDTGVGWSNSVSWLEAPPDSPFRLGLPTRGSLLEAQLNLLLQNRKAKLLGQPTLLTMNGQKATFLSGGEIPIPLVLQNSISVEWKSYGVKLEVEPRVEGIDNIVMRVKPEVSRLDQANAVKLPNVQVPAIATRWTETYMQLHSGESVVISGMLSDEDTVTTNGIPLLSQIPFLGELFRSTEATKQHTELVMTLSPTIVTNPQALPESNYGKQQ